MKRTLVFSTILSAGFALNAAALYIFEAYDLDAQTVPQRVASFDFIGGTRGDGTNDNLLQEERRQIERIMINSEKAIRPESIAWVSAGPRNSTPTSTIGLSNVRFLRAPLIGN